MKAINKGSGIVEIVVGIAIIFTGILALLRTYNYYLKFALAHRYDVQTALLLEEGVEAVKLLRDTGWSSNISTLTPGTDYGLEYLGGTWTATTTLRYIDGKFDRRFVLDEVYRDAGDKIAPSGTLDPNTKKVTVTVSARNILSTTTKSIGTYITNIFNN